MALLLRTNKNKARREKPVQSTAAHWCIEIIYSLPTHGDCQLHEWTQNEPLATTLPGSEYCWETRAKCQGGRPTMITIAKPSIPNAATIPRPSAASRKFQLRPARHAKFIIILCVWNASNTSDARMLLSRQSVCSWVVCFCISQIDKKQFKNIN